TESWESAAAALLNHGSRPLSRYWIMGVRVDWHSVRLAIRADRSRFGNVSQGSLCVRSPSASIVCDRAWCLPPVCTTPYLLARSVLACSVLPGEYLPGDPSERRPQ